MAGGRQPQRLSDETLPADGEAVGDGAQGHRGRCFGIGEDDRLTSVAGLTDAGIQWNLTERGTSVPTNRDRDAATVAPPPYRRCPCAHPMGSSSHDMFSMTPTSRW